MDTSSAATNGEDSIAYQKAGVLDFTDGAPDPSLGFKHNGLGPNASDIFFLERSTNGKSTHGHYDDDFGPETDVDAVDDILMPTTGGTIKSVDNPFLQQDTNEDLEIQRQQSREFDPIQESREEAPTPPADKVKNVGVYVPDSENVGDSGEESEDEWNYYRVEPTGTTAPTLETKQTNQEVCETSASGLEDTDDMEYRLNPDAAEFVPSPTRMKPSMEEIISQSPMKVEELKEVTLIPSEEEFNKEIRLRPGEYDNGAPALPDILNTDSGTGSNEADDSGNLEESLEDEGFYRESSGNWNNDTLIASNINVANSVDKSMFTNSTSVLEQSENVSSVLERSFIEESDVGNSVLGTTDVLSNVSGNAVSSNPFDIDSLAFNEPEKLTTENSIGSKDLSDKPILGDSEHVEQTQVVSFELQKDVAPEMEPIPERVHIDNEESNVFPPGDQIISTNIDFGTAPPTMEYTSDNFDAAPIPEYDGSFGIPTYDGTPNVTLSDIQPTVSSLNHPFDFSNFSVPDITSNFSVPELSSIYVTDTETVVLNEDTFKSKPQHSPIPEEIESLENVIKREEELIDSTSMLDSTNIIDSSNVLQDSVLDKPSVFDNSLIETSEYQKLTSESDTQLPKESPSPLPAYNEQLHDLSSVCSFSAAAYSQPISESENLQTTDFVPYTTDLDPTDPNHPLYRCVYPLPPDILDQQAQHNIIQDIQENSLIQNIEENSQITDDQSQLEKGGFTQDPFGSSTAQIDEPSVLAADNSQENFTIENDKPFISEISEQKTDNLLNSLEITHEGNKPSFEDDSHGSMEEPAVQQTSESCLDELITAAEPQHLVTATPPPTPAVISEDPFSSSITSTNFNSILEPVQKAEAEETKADAEIKTESSGEAGLGLDTVSVAAVSATAAATAVAVGESILQTKTSEQKVPDKKEIVKKTAVNKEKKPLSDKSKVSAITKSTASPKTSTVTSKAPMKTAVSSSKSTPSPLKSTPTSPTKPLSSSLVSTKKPATPPANKTKPVTSTVTKSASPQVKTLSSNSSPRPASATSKTRPATAPVNKTVTDKKPLTLTNGIAPKTSPNGIVSKTSTKRIEQAPPKKLVSSVSSSRTTTRPSTVLSKTTTSTNTTSVNTTKVSSNITQNRTTAVSSTRPKTAPPSGLTAKPKVSSTTNNTVSRIKSSTITTVPTKSVEKHVKETANKQISSVRNGLSATKSTSVASRTVSKTSGSVTKTTTTTVTKQSPVRKVGIKKTTTTTTTTNPAKQNNVNLENNELISEQIETTIITEVKFDPSPIEIAQEAVTE